MVARIARYRLAALALGAGIALHTTTSPPIVANTFDLAMAGPAAAGVEVIAHQDVDLSSLTKKDLKYIFLGKKTKWSNGKSLTIYLQKTGTTHKTFLKKYIGKSSAKYRNYWKKLAFTGKAQPPKRFSSDAAVIKQVASTPGAVAYVTAGATRGKKAKVKLLKIK